MQPIERYGLIALLFLVVTVVAVVLWDRGDANPAPPVVAQAAEQPAPLAGLPAKPRGAARANAESTRGAPPPTAGQRGGLVALPTENVPAPGNGAAPVSGAAPLGAPGGTASLLDAQRETLAQIAAMRDPATQEAALRAELQRDPQHAAQLIELFQAQQRAASAAATVDASGVVRPVDAADPRERAPAALATRTTPAPAMGLAPMTVEPAARAKRTYTVRAGDTLSEISQRELGTAKRYRDILALNPGLDERRLKEGQVLELPPKDAAAAPAGAVAGGTAPTAPTATAPAVAATETPAQTAAARPRTYTVRAGDSLYRIAQRELGDGERHREIAKLNPGIDPDRLRLGQELVLPSGEAAAPRSAPATAAKAPERPVAVANAVPTDKKRSSGVR